VSLPARDVASAARTAATIATRPVFQRPPVL